MKNISYKIFAIIYIAIFYISMLIPITGMFFGFKTATLNSEWRVLAKFPKLGNDLQLTDFPKAFQKYFDDNLGFRDTMLRTYAKIQLNIFKTSPTADNVIGKNKWLFYNPISFVAQNKFKDYYCCLEFTQAELEQLTQKLVDERNWLKKRNVQYILVVVPLKEYIYEEYLPESKKNDYVLDNLRLNQFSKYISQNTDIDVIYLEDTLLNAKNAVSVPIYYQSDYHWNAYGAFFGYQEIMKHFQKSHPDAKIFNLDDFDITVGNDHVGDLMRIDPDWTVKDKRIDFNLKPEVAKTANKYNYLYLFGDSFSNLDRNDGLQSEGLSYFFKNSFKNVEVAGFSGWLIPEAIDTNKPALVVREALQISIKGWLNVISPVDKN